MNQKVLNLFYPRDAMLARVIIIIKKIVHKVQN